ncbi:TPA: hypothetical protein L9W62_000057 [Klebsiella pneumoniae]|nr:hypothetical protein [Klebsiella pneumoniae]
MKSKRGKIALAVVVILLLLWVTGAKTKFVLWQATHQLNEKFTSDGDGGSASYDWDKTITIEYVSQTPDDGSENNPLVILFANTLAPKMIQTVVCQKDEALKLLDYGAIIRFKVMSASGKQIMSAMVNKDSCFQ